MSFAPLTSLHSAAFGAVGWRLLLAEDGERVGELGNGRMRDGCWDGRLEDLKLGTFLGRPSIHPMQTVRRRGVED